MKNIALIVEKSREYGRGLLKGIAVYARLNHPEWTLRLLEPRDLERRAPFAGFDGVIARAVGRKIRAKLRNSRLPVIDAFGLSDDPDFVAVDCDHAAIAKIAARHFIDRGFSSFAFCGFRGTPFSDIRRDAFAAALAAAGFGVVAFTDPEPPDDNIFFSERMDKPSKQGRLLKWLKALPRQTAVFCANDLRAYQLLCLAAEAGRDVPKDLAILGVDDDDLLCSFSTPSLSSIDPNAVGVGSAAARLLAAALTHPMARKRHRTFLVRPVGLIERRSTEVHPVGPDWLSDALVTIDRNLHRAITSEEIVTATGHSHPIVNRAFKSVFGKTIGTYIMDRRLTVARRLLVEENLSAKEIAYRLGFTTPQYFSECFRRHFGQTTRQLLSDARGRA